MYHKGPVAFAHEKKIALPLTFPEKKVASSSSAGKERGGNTEAPHLFSEKKKKDGCIGNGKKANSRLRREKGEERDRGRNQEDDIEKKKKKKKGRASSEGGSQPSGKGKVDLKTFFPVAWRDGKGGRSRRRLTKHVAAPRRGKRRGGGDASTEFRRAHRARPRLRLSSGREVHSPALKKGKKEKNSRGKTSQFAPQKKKREEDLLPVTS